MANKYTTSQVISEKLEAKYGGGNALDGEVSDQNDVTTMVKEGHGGAVGYNGLPTPSKVIVVACYYGPQDPAHEDHVTIDISPAPGSVLTAGATITAPPAADGFDATLLLLKANGELVTLTSGETYTVPDDPSHTPIPDPDLEEVKTSSSTLLDLQIGDMVFQFKKLDKKSNFKIDYPVGTAGIRG